MNDLLDRFLRYVKIDTQSSEHTGTHPSTPGQWDLARLLVSELTELGCTDVKLDENCYVYAELKANTEGNIPVIAFIAHLDTSPDAPGKDVKPQVIENYSGGPIPLPGRIDGILDPAVFPELSRYRGQTVICTDGSTLLGADDKAGIAVIMSSLNYLKEHPEVKHGTLKFAFTPDEEIGQGALLFNVKELGADFGFTFDGGEIGEFETENFNAARAEIKVEGVGVHPGTAKNQMRNAILLAMEFQSLLPEQERPEFTEGYEGFFHLSNLTGNVNNCSMVYLIRDHDKGKFEEKKRAITEAAVYLNRKYRREHIRVEIRDQYYNMKDIIEKNPHIVELAVSALAASDVRILRVPVRGGTDGATLSYMGLPCPNIFTGGHNYHGVYEYTVLESMEKSLQSLINIVRFAVSGSWTFRS